MKGAELGVSVNTRGTFHLVARIYRLDRSSTKRIPVLIQPDQSIRNWYTRQWWVLGKILRKGYSKNSHIRT